MTVFNANNIQLFTTTLFLLSSSSSCHSCGLLTSSTSSSSGHANAPSSHDPPLAIQVQPIMDPSIFHSILFTDLLEELNKLNSTAVYYDSTRDFWENNNNKNNSSSSNNNKDESSTTMHGDCSSTTTASRIETFIACSSLPNMSGYARKKDLTNKLAVVHNPPADPPAADGGTTAKVRLVSRIFMGDAIYNAQDRSCFFVSIPWQRANSLYHHDAPATSTVADSTNEDTGVQLLQEPGKDEENTMIILQPMLPMMKIGLGTVEKVVGMTSSVTNVSILAQLSPAAFAAKKKNHAAGYDDTQYMDDVIRDVQSRSKALCQEDLLRALPYTGSIYPCPDQQLVEALPIKVVVQEEQQKQDGDGDGDDVVRFTIDVSEQGMSKNRTIVAQAILAIVTGLASHSCFDFLEIEEDGEYYYYFST